MSRHSHGKRPATPPSGRGKKRPSTPLKKRPRTKDSSSPHSPDSDLAHLQQLLLQYSQDEKYLPQALDQISNHLQISAAQWPSLQRAAHLLESEDLLRVDDEGRLQAVETLLVTGRISVHHKGFGFLQVGETLNLPHWRGEVFIAKAQMAGAVQGDTVQARVYTARISPKGPEGKVTRILRRERDTAVATLASRCSIGFTARSSLFPGRTISLEPGAVPNLAAGDRVLFRLLNTENPEGVVGEILQMLGSIDDAARDVPIAICEFHLPELHSEQARKEAASFGESIRPEMLAGRVDLREEEIFTVDPATARDFDDALSLKWHEDHYHLGVHIADVAHFVRPGTALDREAQERCNSVYFPGTVVPMLPSELSDNLCSLKPHVERLTVSVSMQFDPSGQLVSSCIERSVIKSCRRFSYEQAREIIEGRCPDPLAPTLERMVQLCQLLKQKRRDRGSVDLAIPEWVVRCDSSGNPEAMEQHEYDFSHQMVEEFMLKANEVVAQTLDSAKRPLIYRIHEPPSEDVMENFVAFASAFGYKLTHPVGAEQVQRLFAEAAEEPFAPQLFLSYIRSMKQALYETHNLGHHGLSLTHYTHFTSPIRRYVDLTVLRSLLESPAPQEELVKIAKLCSERERTSARAEMSVIQLKKMRLLRRRWEGGQRLFLSTITKVRPFGLYFDIDEFFLEGFLHISQLGREYFQFEAGEQVLRAKSGRDFGCGDEITPKLLEVDLIALETEWTLPPLTS